MRDILQVVWGVKGIMGRFPQHLISRESVLRHPSEGGHVLNRAFITKTTSGELGFRNRKSTRDDLLLTDVGVRLPISRVLCLPLPPNRS